MEFPRGRMANPAFAERGRADVVLWDVIEIADGAEIRVVFESSSSSRRQGVFLMIDGTIEVPGIWKSRAMALWRDTAPDVVALRCSTRNGRLHLYNVWESSLGHMRSQTESSGMLIEPIENGFRYRCNDMGFDTAFDKLVFRIEFTDRDGVSRTPGSEDVADESQSAGLVSTPICDRCHKAYGPQSCVGDAANRIPYGMERRFGVPARGDCHDCGVALGGLHHADCDMEECPDCHGQLIGCDCSYDERE